MSLKPLYLYYEKRTSDEVWKIIEDVKGLPEKEAFEKYTIDDKEKFLEQLFEDYQTLINNEAEYSGYRVDDRLEEYAQLKHFL